jgi:Outer membrane protein beta-barrel domain
MRETIRLPLVCGTSAVLLLLAGVPAQAVDIAPFVGLRFGGDVGTQQGGGVTGPTSVTLDSSVSYGGVIDIPLTQPRSLELYYSHQPTKLSGNSAVGDVSMNVLQLGLVDALPSADQQLSWLLAGTVGATQLSARDGSATRPSIGLGGGFEWMATDHIGLRGDLRALLTFSGSGGGAVNCGGGCSVTFHGSLVAQGELSLGVVARF